VAGGTAVAAWITAGVGSFFPAGVLRPTARAFFFAALRPADFNFRLRMAFFVVALRFLGMDIPFGMESRGRLSVHLVVLGCDGRRGSGNCQRRSMAAGVLPHAMGFAKSAHSQKLSKVEMPLVRW